MTIRVNEGPRLPDLPHDAPQYAKDLHRALHLALSDIALRCRALEQTVDIPPRKPNALSGSYAPINADFLVKTANSSLTAERVVTDTATVTWDWSTAGQAKANASGGGITDLTGDVTASGSGSVAATLATVNSNVGTFTNPSSVTANAKGLITAIAGFLTTQTLTDAATIAWDVSLGGVAKVTLGNNRTLGAPTNLVDGGTYVLRIIQDGTGSRTLAYNAVFKWPGGVAPILSTAASAIDVLTFVSDGTNLYGVIQQAFA